MATPTGAYQTYQGGGSSGTGLGNREDLEDAFYMISPTSTPFLTMCARGKADAAYHEWLTDTLSTAGNNIQIEGDDATAVGNNNITSVPPVRMGNYIQNSAKTAVVTDDQEAVTSAGNINRMAHQVAKRMAELKLDMEFALTQNNKSSAGSATVARQLGSLESWLWGSRVASGVGASHTLAAATLGNSISVGSTEATTPSFASLVVGGPTDSSSTNAFTVAALKAVIKNCWVSGGDPQIIMVGGATKQVVSGFTGIATLYREAGKTSKGTAIIGAADLYVSDFGEHRVIPNRNQRNRTVFVLDMDYWSVAYLRSVNQKEIARTGSAMKRFIDVAYTLVARNPASSGKISDVTP